VRLVRVLRLTGHVVQAAAIAATVFPFLSPAQRRMRVRRFSRQLLAILAVRLKVSGEPPRAQDLPAMLVRRWPLIGWLCAQGGTLFIERAQRRHTMNINAQIAAGLRAGDTFAVFPEGTITSGDVVLPFHASLLQPALSCNARLFPVAVRYTRADGSLCFEADYAGAKTLVDSLRLILTQPVIHVHLQFLPPLACASRHRRELAHDAAARIAAALNLPSPQRRTRKASRP
jgi:1-acyl-sn-glycerol-3-phosphate acyltransferase